MGESVPPAPGDQRLTRYLLGRSSADERDEIELEYLALPERHDELRAVERDLIDRYVYGELTNPSEFEAHFLSTPGRRERVDTARALKQSLATASGVACTVQPPSLGSSRGPWISVAAALLLLAGAGLFLVWPRQNPPPAVAQVPEQPRDGSAAAPASPSASTPAREVTRGEPAGRMVTLVLLPTLSRSADATTPTLIIERDVRAVRLELHLEAGDYSRYRARVRTGNGAEVSNQDALRSERTSTGPTVIVTLPAGRLNEQDYTVVLAGVAADGEADDVGSYYFTVQRK